MNFHLIRAGCTAVACAGLLSLTSCATAPGEHALGPKFQEAHAANLVLRYSSDQTIFMLKPDGHDGPFYRIFTREEVCALDAQRIGRRDLAVVLLGFSRAPILERRIRDSWVASLGSLNYRRVIFLRSADHDQINGLRVIEDRALAKADTQPPEMAAATEPELAAR
jgi:hypothetical protein